MTRQERSNKVRGEIAEVLSSMLPKEVHGQPIPAEVASAATLFFIAVTLDEILSGLGVRQ